MEDTHTALYHLSDDPTREREREGGRVKGGKDGGREKESE